MPTKKTPQKLPKINPCPFCGANGILIENGHFWWVNCKTRNCLLGPASENRRLAIRFWNSIVRT